jgi:hypothetical protein
MTRKHRAVGHVGCVQPLDQALREVIISSPLSGLQDQPLTVRQKWVRVTGAAPAPSSTPPVPHRQRSRELILFGLLKTQCLMGPACNHAAAPFIFGYLFLSCYPRIKVEVSGIAGSTATNTVFSLSVRGSSSILLDQV